MDVINSGHSVLIVYEASQRLDNLINELKSKAREIETKKPNDVLNVDQNVSKYDVVLCENFAFNDEGKLFTALLKQCKPQGRIIIQQVVINNSKDQFILKLKLSGCTNISEPKNIQLSDDEKKHIQLKLNTTEQVSLIEVICSKPSFELGSSAKLNLKPKVDISSVWKIDDTVDEDVETIDPDNLLDEDDLKKSDVQDLRVCSTTGKRKACKDCSCGLADELMEEAGKKEAKDMPKSSCGNCYLGDAFRCAGCPYRGMPAFKPGEKIRLTSDQLEADT